MTLSIRSGVESYSIVAIVLRAIETGVVYMCWVVSSLVVSLFDVTDSIFLLILLPFMISKHQIPVICLFHFPFHSPFLFLFDIISL